MKTVEIYLAAKGITNAIRQRAILLHCAGNDIQDIAANNLTDTGLDFETLVNKFKRYFSSRNNVVFERYEFRRCVQEPGEGIDSWYTRLRMKVSTCEFETQTDSIIRDQVSNISLEDTLKIGRSLETAHLPAAAIEDNESQETTLPLELAALRHLQRYKGPEPEWAKRGREQTRITCYRCGESGPSYMRESSR